MHTPKRFFRFHQKFASLDSRSAFGVGFKPFAVDAMKWINLLRFFCKNEVICVLNGMKNIRMRAQTVGYMPPKTAEKIKCKKLKKVLDISGTEWYSMQVGCDVKNTELMKCP